MLWSVLDIGFSMSGNILELLSLKCRSTEEEISGLRSRNTTIQQEVSGRCKAFEETISLLGNNPENLHLRKKLEDKIRKERQAVEQSAAELAEAEARLSGYKDAIKMLGKDADDPTEPELRAGSELFRIREAIRAMGQPLSLAQMLEALGEQDNPQKRNSVRGSVGRYARDNKIFVQTAPNTFGLLELNHKPQTESEVVL